jgi:hypothetical protein
MIRQRLDSPERAGDAEDGLKDAESSLTHPWQESEESSVALYSLGSPALLAAASERKSIDELFEDDGAKSRDVPQIALRQCTNQSSRCSLLDERL